MVYRAFDRELGETVAIKVLRPDVARESGRVEQRFRSEIRLARRVRHRNVCSVYGDGEDRGPPLHLHGARRGREPRPPRARGRRPAARRRRGASRCRWRTGLQRDPRGGHRPPRPQDREPDARPRRGGAGDGLRDRQAARGGRGRRDGHRHRHPDGHARVHEPGAAPRRRGGLPQRPLLARRSSSTSCSPARCRSAATRRSRPSSAAAGRPVPRPAGAAGAAAAGAGPGARQGPRRPLRDGRRDARGRWRRRARAPARAPRPLRERPAPRPDDETRPVVPGLRPEGAPAPVDGGGPGGDRGARRPPGERGRRPARRRPGAPARRRARAVAHAHAGAVARRADARGHGRRRGRRAGRPPRARRRFPPDAAGHGGPARRRGACPGALARAAGRRRLPRLRGGRGGREAAPRSPG